MTYISAFAYFLRQFCLVWTEIWCVLVGNGLDYLVVCLLCCLLPGFKTSLVDLFVSSSNLECDRSGHSVRLKCSCTCKPRRAPLTSDLSLTSRLRDLCIGYHLVVLWAIPIPLACSLTSVRGCGPIVSSQRPHAEEYRQQRVNAAKSISLRQA